MPELPVDPYRVLAMVQASVGDQKKTYIGEKGTCRFCLQPGATFKNEAHAFPEGLGNK
jgi:hypothetical protein